MTYINLLSSFVEGNLSADKFEVLFLNKFKSGRSFGSDKEFQALDILFEEVDAYCSDFNLFDPEQDTDEDQLRAAATETLSYLRTIKLLKTL